MAKSGLTFEHFSLEVVKNCRKFFFIFYFTLQNMVETTLPDGLETSKRKKNLTKKKMDQNTFFFPLQKNCFGPPTFLFNKIRKFL